MTTQHFHHWKRHDDASEIVWLHLDVAGEPVNLLSSEVFTELEIILDDLEASAPHGLAFISDKNNGFIAGADVKEFTKLANREAALDLIRLGQGLMDRIDALPCPTVAVINGFCMGGGLELSLACDYRIGLDDPKTRLGLPEIKLGIHPGYGGTVRALQLLGPSAAMDLMLTGRSLDVHRAKRMGLIDHTIPQRHLVNAARYLIDAKPPPSRPSRLVSLMNAPLLRALVARKMRTRVARKANKSHYPAPYALIDLWERHAGNKRKMLAKEGHSVADLSTTETTRNLVRVFMLQNQLKATGDKSLFKPWHVHVIGGGLMGGDIAAWCAMQGFRVTVQDTNTTSLATALKRSAELFKGRFEVERLVNNALDRLIPDANGAGIPQADVIIEAIFEDIEAKQSLYQSIETKFKSDAWIATNTSSIPIETLAEGLSEPGRLVGLHFFYPVSKIPLVEIVRGQHTREDVIAKASAFTRHIDKLPLKVKSTPGFLVNRVLTPYLLEAVILESEGVPKTVIDKVVTDFGMPVGPIELVDSVGLDVGLHVGEILAKTYGFEIPAKLKAMVESGHLGRKSGRGFYEYRRNKPLKDKRKRFEGDTEELQSRLILRLINEAVACLREGVVENADLVDAGVIFGAGFAPFTGGPLHYLENQGRKTLQASLKRLENHFGARFEADRGW